VYGSGRHTQDPTLYCSPLFDAIHLLVMQRDHSPAWGSPEARAAALMGRLRAIPQALLQDARENLEGARREKTLIVG
jgi:hypothetical protein